MSMLRSPLGAPVRPLARKVTEAGGGALWRAALPALRTFVTANYNQPNPRNQAAMASPPTVAVLTAKPAEFTEPVLYGTPAGAVIRYTGGWELANTTIRNYVTRIASVVAESGGTFDNGRTATAWRAGIRTSASRILIGVKDTAPNYRLIVNGQYATTAGYAAPILGGSVFLDVNFGSSVEREVEIECGLGDALEGFYFLTADAANYSALAPAGRRMIVMGDSFAEGQGPTGSQRYHGLAFVAGDMLGIDDTVGSGSGGTGYVDTVSGTKYKLSERLSDCNGRGSWDVIVVAMGVNDIGEPSSAITNEVAACLSSIRANNPSAQIFVVGPWDQAAPAAPAASYTACKSAIVAGVAPGVGVTFLDPQGVTYTKADGLHPDAAGHKTLGDWLALQIKTALGA